MPRKLRPAVDFHQQRFMQITESHCGPAVIQMLLSREGIDVTQEEVAEAGGAAQLIALNGMRVDQLARAVHRLAPGLLFYYKDHSTISELVRIVLDYRQPAGVEWQGVFEDEEDEDEDDDEEEEEDGSEPGGVDQVMLDDSESEDDDYGHYSVAVWADRRRRQLIIADPYKDYFSQARIFGFEAFDRRWYDFNEVPDPVTGQPVVVEDDHLLFVVVRRNVLFPRRMGMKLFLP
jgi:hypothetical protein